MPEIDRLRVLVSTAIVIAAGLLRWWSGRRLIAFAADPAFPERLMAARRQNAIVFAVCAAALFGVSAELAVWTVPFLILSRAVAGYPLRKAIYDETWSIFGYLWFFARLIACFFGFWLALALLPAAARLGGTRSWLVAVLFAGILMVWNRHASDVIRRVLRSRPVDDPALRERFAALVAKCSIAPPHFERVALHGGSLANAVAVASVRRPAVLLTDPLLERLEPDETVAICAHELAHLEHFNRASLRRINAVNYLLIVLGTIIAMTRPFDGFVAPSLLWAALLVIVLGLRARNRQRNETASDVRAVELAGDGEALVRALTKLYLFARLPRRMDPGVERRATHPSLARRIRDIRKAAGVSPVTLPAGSAFTSADGRIVAVFDDARLEWREGDAATHSLSYGHLSELRVRPQRSGPAHLVAVERGGRRWEMPLQAADLARAQSVLDTVDGHLPDVPASRPAEHLARPVAGIAAIVAFGLGQFALVLVSVIAAARPSAPLLAGAALAALASALVMLRQGPLTSALYPSWLAIVPAALALLLFAFARSIGRKEEESDHRRTVAGALFGVVVALGVVPLLLGGLDAVGLHDSALANPGAAVLLAALAGRMAFGRKPMVRYASLGVAIVAVAVTSLASTAFLNRFGKDAFLVRADPVAVRTVGANTIGQFSLPFFLRDLRLSPGGRHVVAIPVTANDDDEETPTFRVGAAGGVLAPLTAEDVLFLDEDHVLVLQAERDGMTLREFALEPVKEVWQHHVADLRNAQLSCRPSIRRWRLLGRNGQQEIVRAEGVVGTSVAYETRWSVPDTRVGWIDTIAAAGDRALVSETSVGTNFLQQRRTLWAWASLVQPPQRESRFWTVGGIGRMEVAVSRLGPRCLDGALGDERLVCAAFDGSETRFVALDPASGRLDAIGSLPGRFAVYQSAAAGWLSGWSDETPVALRLSTHEAFRAAPDPFHRIAQVTASGSVAGTVAFDGGRSIVRVYSID
jgi:Zn-dependent protease with chaperone function